ncbi:hypothetical protein [Pyxidicoccus trucidator]|uniref:hypothetical protein n=1 Tax=Pyxidicoccus trucidator TaxID=2709662 RepID=UPI001F0885BE|nr:hypothetical protein [Pyxidicoccus trucidator]
MLSPQAMADWYPDRQLIEEVSARGLPLERIERRAMPSLDVQALSPELTPSLSISFFKLYEPPAAMTLLAAT